jgi:polyketide biosynthesis 3-hydroxy-3-methylglutaryl-CoA synthase-like enzyme PksG
MSAYCGLAYVDVDELWASRNMDPARMRNLGMHRKTVALPCEDPVTYAVNAARPLLARLTAEQVGSIELLIIGTESGLDFSKSVGTWVHRLLGLPRTCRLFEVKQACYAGIAALQSAVAQIAISPKPDARALVIGVDVPRLIRHTTAEPSQGAGAVAALVSAHPRLAVAELGRAGYASFDVTDVCRPTATDHIWDPDLSLASYLDCLKTATADYVARTPGTDLRRDFDRLVFHTPFPGAVKGAHRSLLRGLGPNTPAEVAEDFASRVADSIRYPADVGNIYAGTALLALLSLIDHDKPSEQASRIGLFSYGSGCSAEFCSYVLPAAEASAAAWDSGTTAALEARTTLSVEEYDEIADANDAIFAGVADYVPPSTDWQKYASTFAIHGSLLMLTAIRGHARHYDDVTVDQL